MSREDSCENRVDTQLASTLEDLQTLWDLYCKDPDGYDDDLGNLNEYGLSFDYVEPDTFPDQREGFFRYQMSWGGPSDEFRFYVNPDGSMHRAEYWFMDWFDGAHRNVTDNDLVSRLWEWFEPSWSHTLSEIQ